MSAYRNRGRPLCSPGDLRRGAGRCCLSHGPVTCKQTFYSSVARNVSVKLTWFFQGCLFSFFFFYCSKVHIKISVSAIFKCAVQWDEIHSYYCATTTTIRPWNVSRKAETPCPPNSSSQALSQPWHRNPTSVSVNVLSRSTSCERSSRCSPLVTGLSQSRVSARPSPPQPGRSSLPWWVPTTSVYWPLADGHLCCCHVFAAVNDAARNMAVKISFRELAFNSYRWIPRSRMAGSFASSVLVF